jgi:import inner membrane translocase subunit TIM10
MVTSCHKKCVVKHNESDLQVGEMACIDRCVGKYNQTQELVGAMLYKFEQDQQAKEKAAGGKPK